MGGDVQYLDDLRRSGQTNMYAAGAYVAGHFDLDEEIARKVLTAWMETFAERAGPLERVDHLMQAS